MKSLNKELSLIQTIKNHKTHKNKNIFIKWNKNFKIWKSVLDSLKIYIKANKEKLRYYQH